MFYYIKLYIRRSKHITDTITMQININCKKKKQDRKMLLFTDVFEICACIYTHSCICLQNRTRHAKVNNIYTPTG